MAVILALRRCGRTPAAHVLRHTLEGHLTVRRLDHHAARRADRLLHAASIGQRPARDEWTKVHYHSANGGDDYDYDASGGRDQNDPTMVGSMGGRGARNPPVRLCGSRSPGSRHARGCGRWTCWTPLSRHPRSGNVASSTRTGTREERTLPARHTPAPGVVSRLGCSCALLCSTSLRCSVLLGSGGGLLLMGAPPGPCSSP